MTETVTVALITLAAGVLGSGIGAFATYKVAKLSSSNEQKAVLRANRQLSYHTLITDYNEFCTFYACSEIGFHKELYSEHDEVKLYEKFQCSCIAARLVASEATHDAINRLLYAVSECADRHGSSKDLNEPFSSMEKEMRKDLGVS